MVYSAEMRWFFKNRAEIKLIEKWFNTQGLFLANKWDRADIYLWQPGLNKLNVKIREGKIEVKILLADRGVTAFANHNTGLANDWVKYSFGLQESDEENEKLLQQFSEQPGEVQKQIWVRVDKERLLIKFSVDPVNNSWNKVPENTWPEEGCGVELTRIRVHDKTYYSFGLEAFSKTRQEPRNLEITLQHIIPEIQVIYLNHHHSNSYPGFLQELYFAS
jgi:hypothetical protein